MPHPLPNSPLQAVAELPTRESVVAWGFASVLQKGEVSCDHMGSGQHIAKYRFMGEVSALSTSYGPENIPWDPYAWVQPLCSPPADKPSFSSRSDHPRHPVRTAVPPPPHDHCPAQVLFQRSHAGFLRHQVRRATRYRQGAEGVGWGLRFCPSRVLINSYHGGVQVSLHYSLPGDITKYGEGVGGQNGSAGSRAGSTKEGLGPNGMPLVGRGQGIARLGDGYLGSLVSQSIDWHPLLCHLLWASRPMSSNPIVQVKEDVPGVPSDAWCRVTRGVPPLDPFTPGAVDHTA